MIRSAGLPLAGFVALCCVFACRESDPKPPPIQGTSTTTHPLLTTSLTAHYPLNETTGTTATDASGNNNPATFTTPTPPPTAPWTTAGRISGAANLTVGSYLQIQPSAALNAITTAITVATWIRRDTNPATGDQYIIYRRNATLGSVVHGHRKYKRGTLPFTIPWDPGNRVR